MASRARKTPSHFKGLEGFPRLIQARDEIAMLRALYIGSVVVTRERYRRFDPVTHPEEKALYDSTCNLLANTMRTASTQTRNTRNFFTAMGFDPDVLTVDDLPAIQDKMQNCRIVYFNYHHASGLCTLNWAGDIILPQIIYIVSYGTKWDVLTATKGLYGKFLCGACLKTSKNSVAHRCEHTCTSCNSLLAEGNCNGNLNLHCGGCSFKFNTQKCFDEHKRIKNGMATQTRCDILKYCVGCNSVYRAVNGHTCGESVYCQLCEDYQSNQHECVWPEFKEKTRANLQKEQREFSLAFYDIESTQCNGELPNGDWDYLPQHFCTTISLVKVCFRCENEPVDEPCPSCGVRAHVFNYESKNEGDYEVVDRFCSFLMKDPTMENRVMYAHNGGRFDIHLVLEGFLRIGIRPEIVNKGSNLIRTEVKLRGKKKFKKIVFKDSYAVIPMPLSEFSKAFELSDCEQKGTFPHMANYRSNWGRTWPSIPPKRFFSYDFMKPSQRASFEEWHASMEGKPWNQDAEIVKYCLNDSIIYMKGCLAYRQTMIKATNWCPLTCSNTLASFCQFLLRAEHLDHSKMPNLPEAGYGAVNQSKIAMLYFKWLERDPERKYRHAQSPMGELKVKIDHHTYSIDCYEESTDTAIEVMGCYYHGCVPRCYAAGTLLVGKERADELRARTMDRVERLKTRFKEVKVIWECELNAMVAADPAMKKFFETEEVIERLKMRDALYGGRVEVLRTYLQSTLQTAVKYYDICSMYPSVMSMNEYPLGQPEVITSNFKPIVGTEIPYRGLVKARVLPPQNLEVAILPYRHNKALYFNLCAACVKESCEECTHTNEMDRAWVGTYASVELTLALENGYKVLEVYEVWHWSEWSNQVYREYFKHFIKSKFAASGFPADVGEDRQKQKEYCTKIGRKLGFDLQPEEVVKSSALRTVSKFCNNSGWGKLAEVPIRSKVEYLTIKAYKKLQMDATREIIDFKFMGDDIALVTHKSKVESIRANRFAAVHHAVHVTAYARVLLYSIIKKAGRRAAYVDTDSIVFEMDRSEPDPLGDLLTGELGDLTDEIKDGWQIKEVVFAGCKNYSMLLENLETGATEYKQALRGFTKDFNTLSTLKHEVIKEMVIEKNPNDFVEVKRPELKRKIAMVTTQEQTKRWRPVSFKRATRGEREAEIKVPFGYIPDSI